MVYVQNIFSDLKKTDIIYIYCPRINCNCRWFETGQTLGIGQFQVGRDKCLEKFS